MRDFLSILTGIAIGILIGFTFPPDYTRVVSRGVTPTGELHDFEVWYGPNAMADCLDSVKFYKSNATCEQTI